MPAWAYNTKFDLPPGVTVGVTRDTDKYPGDVTVRVVSRDSSGVTVEIQGAVYMTYLENSCPGVNHTHVSCEKDIALVKIKKPTSCNFQNITATEYHEGGYNSLDEITPRWGFETPADICSFTLHFGEALFDQTPPQLDVSFDENLWASPDAGISVSTTATDDNSGIQKIEYQIVQ